VISLDDATDEVDRRFRLSMREFLETPKDCRRDLVWRLHKSRRDYALTYLPVHHGLIWRRKARIMLMAHTFFEPRKYSFSLLFGNIRIVSLDIDPARPHKNRNLLRKPSVLSTHWSYYPCVTVTPDIRNMSHREWFDVFLKVCNIKCSAAYDRPPHDREQMSLNLGMKR
jgi:hypothetical protein